MTQSLLDVHGLTIETVGNNSLRLVDDVSLSLGAGETLGLVGESGSGKSLTLRAILGLLPEGTSRSSGAITFDGEPLGAPTSPKWRQVRGTGVGMIFQDPMTALNPVMKVGDQIAEGPITRLGVSHKEGWRRAIDLMERVGIPDAAHQARAYPYQFSGGMRQRVMIAIALSCSPSLLLCDEPTTALDVTTQKQVLDIIRDLQADLGLAVLFVTHDLAVISEVCRRVAVMYAGRIVEIGDTRTVFRYPQHGYTLGLLRAAPDPKAIKARLEPIPGLPPDPASWPLGCRFAPRCQFATESCSHEGRFDLKAAAYGSMSACIHQDQVLASARREPVIHGA